MAKKNANNNKATEQVVEAVAQENTINMSAAEMAAKLAADYEVENKKAQERQKGQSLPMRDIVEGVDMLMDAAGKNSAAIGWLVERVPKLLAVKYAEMGNSTNLIAVRMGHQVKNMPNNEVRALREGQLKHMLDPKTKDNFYRRIYNMGFRGIEKRFELQEGSLVRKVVQEEA